ncbi:MAG: tetratricopeptide repeat protein [Phycisphaerae bacterium]|nr:tetratricopeptide repeat protein [Phycisphaerae bacterium]
MGGKRKRKDKKRRAEPDQPPGQSPPAVLARRAAPALLLVLMTVLALWPATHCAFVWDDRGFVQNNELLRSFDGLRRIWFELGAQPYQYYPLVHTTYWFEYRCWKLNPAGYHVVNILLHTLSTVLLWRLLIFLQVPGAWVAAAVFGLHPVHVESVAWITERKNVLSGVFYLSAALVYLRFALSPRAAAGRWRSARWYLAALALFLCALFSKTVTCTLPAVLLLVLWWKLGRLRRSDVLAMVPFFVCGIGFGLLTAWMETDVKYVSAVGEEWSHTFVERGLIAGRALCFYAGKLVWPEPLMFIYPRWRIEAGAWPQYLYPLAAAGVMLALWLARGRIGPGPLVAVLCFAGTLFPALGFFNVYFMRFTFVSDHFQYLASIGLIALIVAVGYYAVGRLGGVVKRAAPVGVAFVLVTLGILSWRQTHVYLKPETLWRDAIQSNPDAWMARNNLGTILRAQGKLDEAIGHYRQALRAKPDFTDAHNNLGVALALQGDLDAAIGHYRQALQFNPALHQTQCNLGNALMKQGQADEAVAHYHQALRHKSDFVEAHYNLALALKKTGSFEEALDHFRAALRLKPGWTRASDSVARLLAEHPDLAGGEGN